MGKGLIAIANKQFVQIWIGPDDRTITHGLRKGDHILVGTKADRTTKVGLHLGGCATPGLNEAGPHRRASRLCKLTGYAHEGRRPELRLMAVCVPGNTEAREADPELLAGRRSRRSDSLATLLYRPARSRASPKVADEANTK